MRAIVGFDTKPLPPLAEVGGKGLSLLRMAQADVAVPPAVVLTTSYFAPWIETLRATPEWARFVAEARADLPELTATCDALKRRADTLTLAPAQRDELLAAVDPLGPGTFAVRSSSPEEDLEEASFAGGYETVLGVTRAALEPAIRRAFTSCLDARVAAYKREHGFDPTTPRIAVVVQRQIASDVAGVGLSIDPISNSYDTAVFNASWGLGESVVSGRVTPDQFMVDKVSRRVLGRRVGAKETAIWLQKDGGTVERPDPRTGELTLTDEQLLALCEQLVRIEALYGRPMDIEWAFAGGSLFLLQARPMTAFVDLPEDLRTKPGDPKRLYFDVTLAVQGFSRPLSVAGTSVLAEIARTASTYVTGQDVTSDLDVSVGFARHGRLYANLSRVLVLFGKARLVRALRAMDPATGEAIATADEATYARGSRPSPRTILRMVPMIAFRVLRAALRPAAYRAELDARIARHLEMFPDLARADLPLPELARSLLLTTIQLVLRIAPGVAMWIISMARIRAMFPHPTDEQARAIGAIDQSLPGNVTVDMGLALAKLPEDVTSEAWKAFLARYGHRGPAELDVVAPRYRENPKLLLDQVHQLAKGAQDPAAMYERNQQQRRDAAQLLGKVAGRRLRRAAKTIEALGGLRETPKFLLIKVVDVLRSRILDAGEKLAAAGRIDASRDVFDLTLSDIADGLRDTSLDLRTRRAERLAPVQRLARARQLPSLIDSRGLILRAPPKPLRPGELSGQPVSVGVARGRVKVLHAPDEKPLLAGEVLVARATDPGWTPLFVNAAAVVLEVGGVLQHGALVAREYGKPCVSGVENATTRLRDGQLIEVDGAAGTIRLLND